MGPCAEAIPGADQKASSNVTSLDSLVRHAMSLRSYVDLHREVRTFGIGPRDLVADIGSGQAPHPRANVLCDKFVADSTERSVNAALLADRPLVVADATRTPFPKRSLDFTFCRHLLEHVVDPAALLDELARISKAGYVETPSRIYEKLYGWEFHRWYVDIQEGALRIESKGTPIFDGDLHSWFGLNLRRGRFWRFFIPRLLSHGLLTTIVWRGTIAYEVIGEASSDVGFISSSTGEPGEVASPDEVSRSQAVRSRVDRWLRRASDPLVPALLDSLECVECRAPLGPSVAGVIGCPQCSAQYAQTADGIEVLPAS